MSTQKIARIARGPGSKATTATKIATAPIRSSSQPELGAMASHQDPRSLSGDATSTSEVVEARIADDRSGKRRYQTKDHRSD